MVRYTGRCASQITANSTNQTSLKLSGSGGGIGSRFRNVGKRVTDNVKVCGPVYRHGVIWSTNTKENSICVPPAPKCQSIAGGVGVINAPRFSCARPSEKLKREQAAAAAAAAAVTAAREKTRREYQAAYDIMNDFLAKEKPGFKFALVGDDPESFGSDEGMAANAPWSFDRLKWSFCSFEPGTFPLPDVQDQEAFYKSLECDFPTDSAIDWLESWGLPNDGTEADPKLLNPLMAASGITTLAKLQSMNSDSFALSKEDYDSYPDEVKKAIDKFNNLELRMYINKYYKVTTPGVNGKILHKIGIISDDNIATLKTWGYGVSLGGIDIFGSLREYASASEEPSRQYAGGKFGYVDPEIGPRNLDCLTVDHQLKWPIACYNKLSPEEKVAARENAKKVAEKKYSDDTFAALGQLALNQAKGGFLPSA